MAGGAKVDSFTGSQFRMSEFTGGVLVAQLRKLDRIVESVRRARAACMTVFATCPASSCAACPIRRANWAPAVFLGFDTKAQCERFRAAMKAENVPASLPGGSAILPIAPHVEHKRTVHPAWPSFTSERGRAIQLRRRVLSAYHRYSQPLRRRVARSDVYGNDTDDIVAAIRKVYPQIVRG